jgi:hypothetical protein
MREKLPDKHTDPERYEQEQARRMRADREERAAYEVAWNAAWQAELGKPMASRQWFRSGDLLDELATNTQTLEVDAGLRCRIFKKLATVVQYRQFADGEVATLRGDLPSFVSLPPPSRDSITVFEEDLMLRRDFVQRFIKVNVELPNALPLQRHWFAEFNQETAASLQGVVGADASEHAATRKASTERQHPGQYQETDAAHATPASHSAAAAGNDAEIINSLAEWVFRKQ